MAQNESPRRVLVAVVVALALTALAVPALAALLSAVFPAADPRFKASIACAQSGKPSRTCVLGDLVRARFRDRLEAKTRYARCVATPSGARYCEQLQTGIVPDVAIDDVLDADRPGAWSVAWIVHGRRVAGWDFYVRSYPG